MCTYSSCGRDQDSQPGHDCPESSWKEVLSTITHAAMQKLALTRPFPCIVTLLSASTSLIVVRPSPFAFSIALYFIINPSEHHDNTTAFACNKKIASRKLSNPPHQSTTPTTSIFRYHPPPPPDLQFVHNSSSPRYISPLLPVDNTENNTPIETSSKHNSIISQHIVVGRHSAVGISAQ
jgi:hypothetical protein